VVPFFPFVRIPLSPYLPISLSPQSDVGNSQLAGSVVGAGRSEISSVSINPSIQSANDLANPNLQDIADAEKSRDGNRAPCLDLLPMACGETKGDHVLLAVPLPSTQVTDALAKCLEEFGVIHHATICTGPRAEVPRAD
jgi:hypothetical protein